MTVQTVGPQTAVAGTPLEFDIGSDRAWIQVHNDTPNKLYIQFDGGKPIQTNANVGAGYGGYVPPWSHPVIFTPGQSANSLYGFQGKVWVMPVSVASQLALTGQGSSLAEVHLDAGSSDDPAPQSWSMPRQQDATSQQRVVSIPWTMDTGTIASANSPGSTMQFGAIGALPAAGATKDLYMIGSGFQQGGSYLIILYWAGLWPNDNATAGGIEFELIADMRTAGGASMLQSVLARGQCYWGATDAICTPYAMPGGPRFFPFLQGLLPGTVDHVTLMFKTIGVAAATSNITYEIAADVNLVGFNPNGVTPPQGYGITGQGGNVF